ELLALQRRSEPAARFAFPMTLSVPGPTSPGSRWPPDILSVPMVPVPYSRLALVKFNVANGAEPSIANWPLLVTVIVPLVGLLLVLLSVRMPVPVTLMLTLPVICPENGFDT